MTQETQQKILAALDRMFVELSSWLKGLGVPESKAVEIYDAIVRENGIGSRLISESAKGFVPLASEVATQPVTFEECRTRIQSGQYAAWLLEQPEPSPEQLEKLLKACRDALANLRQHFFQTAKAGPQHRHGGRPKELNDPKKRKEVRERVKQLRGPGSNLNSIFARVGREYNVSATTIKRIWSEKPTSEPASNSDKL